MTGRIFSAWDLIGFDGTTEQVDRCLRGGIDCASPDYRPRPAQVRTLGGRTLYEAVGNDGGEKVRLSRLATTEHGLTAVVRYVDADTLLEVIEG